LTMISFHNLLRDRKAISTVFGMVFFLLIVIVVFSSFVIILNQNTGLQQTVMRTNQMSLDKANEKITISQQSKLTYFTNISANSITVNCNITNIGTLPVQIIRLWIEDLNNSATGSLPILATDNISALQQGESQLYNGTITIQIANPANDKLIFWFETARGNQFTAEQLTGGLGSSVNIYQILASVFGEFLPDYNSVQWALVNHNTGAIVGPWNSGWVLPENITGIWTVWKVDVTYYGNTTIAIDPHTCMSFIPLSATAREEDEPFLAYIVNVTSSTLANFSPAGMTINPSPSGTKFTLYLGAEDEYSTGVAPMGTGYSNLMIGMQDEDEFNQGAYMNLIIYGKSPSTYAQTFPLFMISTRSYSISINPISGHTATTVTVTGTGFDPSTRVTLAYDGVTETTSPATITSSASSYGNPGGAFTATFTVPLSAAGGHTVSATDANYNVGIATFTVTPSLATAPSNGPSGTPITCSGTGFAADSPISFTFAGIAVSTSPATVVTDDYGSFSGATFVALHTPAGAQTIVATDGNSNSDGSTFTVTVPSITLNPTTGNTGTIITVTGTTFLPNSPLVVSYDGVTVATTTSTFTGALPAGLFFAAPASTYGSHSVTVTDGFSNSATATFSITSSISISPANGPVGTTVLITGQGFAGTSTITVTFNGAGVSTAPSSVVSDSFGSFSCTTTVPAATAGAKTIRATDVSSHFASATFTVTTPSITLNPTGGSVGTSITVTGSNFIPNSLITIKYDTIVQSTSPSTVTATSSGSFSGTISAPASAYGSHTVSVADAVNTASGTFTINPSIILNPSSGIVGTTITISGTGFTASKTITASFGGNSVTLSGTTTTDANGSFSAATFTVPSQTVGAKSVIVTDASTRSASATFMIIPAIILNPTIGDVGSTVTISGTSYNASSTMTMKYDGTTLATTPPTVTTNASGAFSCTFIVPVSTYGLHSISATDSSSNTASTQFTVNQVTQLITVSLNNAAPSATVNINGGYASPATFTADGTAKSITMAKGSSFTLSFTNSGSTRDGFSNAGSFSAISASYTASSTPISTAAFEQVQNTYSATFNGGNPTTGDTLTLTGTYMGGASTILTLNVGGVSSNSSAAWSDYNTSVTFSSGTSLSNSTQRWTTNGAYSTPALVAGGNTYSQTFIHQYLFTLSYAVSGGGSPSAPTLTSTQLGGAITPILTGSTTGYWLDSGASWSVSPNPLNGSSGSERWQTVQTVSGTVSAVQATVFTYNHQYQMTFSSTGLNGNAGSATVLAVGSTNYAWNALPSNVWVNSGTSYGWANPVSVNATNQFNLTTGSNGTVTTSATLSVSYQEQFKVTFQQTGLDSSATSTVVIVNGVSQTYNNLPFATAWINAGGTVTYTYSNTVTSSTNGKQFRINSITGLSSPITVNSPITVTGNFVTQWQMTFQVAGLDSDGTGTILTLGANSYVFSQLPQVNSWLDDGTTYSFTNPVPVDSSKQYALTGASGVASPIHASGTVAGNYKTQYKATFTQTGIDSSAGSNTVLTVGGTNYAYNALPSNIWVDNGTIFSWSTPVSGGTTKQFAITGSTGVSPITSAGAYTATYKTQYRQTITSSPAIGAGYITVDGNAQATPYQSWWDSGSSHTIAANSSVTLVAGQSQYLYSSWNDSGAQSHSVSPAAATTYTANFQLQYYFSVSSARDTPTGQGWYNSGSSVSSSVTRPVSGGAGTQYETTGWTGTGSLSSGGTSGSTSTGAFTINSYTTCTWNWKTQYQVTFTQTGIDSSAGSNTVLTVGGTTYAYNALPSIWVDSGTIFSWASPVSGGTGKQFTITGSTGTSPITANGTYTATYKTVAITKLGTDTSTTSTSLTTSWSHTLVAGSNRMIAVCIGIEHSGVTVNSVTYGGRTMTRAVSYEASSSGVYMLTQIWYLLEANLPANGARTVTVTATANGGSISEVSAFCAEYNGVKQSAPEDTDGVSQYSGNTITNTISPSTNSWVISSSGAGDVGSWTAGSPQTEVLDFGGTTSCYSVAELRGASGQTALSSTYSGTVNRLARVAASFQAAP
jgi:hypothetical protein